jgi:uncharacterized protein YgiM (DUF1202 family)
MKGRIIDPQVKVYGEPDPGSLTVASLASGDEVDFIGMHKVAKKNWAEVALSGGQKGYLPAETKLFFFKQASLQKTSSKIYSRPSSLSSVKGALQKKDRFYILDVIDRDSKEPWVKIRDLSGAEGFIDGNARIKVITEVTRALGKRTMMSGGLWCLAGILFASGVIQVASNLGAFIIIWGAIAYGTVQFFRGFYQFWNAPY